ncbi:MAG: CcmD family protein [Nitrospinota bacterium]
MGYVVAAYTIVWLVMLGYLWSLARRWESVREELRALRRALAEREGEEFSAKGPAGSSASRGEER